MKSCSFERLFISHQIPVIDILSHRITLLDICMIAIISRDLVMEQHRTLFYTVRSLSSLFSLSFCTIGDKVAILVALTAKFYPSQQNHYSFML